MGMMRRDIAAGTFRCELCGIELDPKAKRNTLHAAELDHRVRVIDGGDEWAQSNLRWLCSAHHRQLTAQQNAEHMRGKAKQVEPKPELPAHYDEWSGRDPATLKPWHAYVGQSVDVGPFMPRVPQAVLVDTRGVLSIGSDDGSDEVHRVWTGARWVKPSEMREEFPPGRVPPAETAA